MGIVVYCCRWEKMYLWVSLSDATADGSHDRSLFPSSGEAGPVGIIVCCSCLEKLVPWGSSSIATVGSRRIC